MSTAVRGLRRPARPTAPAAPGLVFDRVSMRLGDRTVVEDCSFALEPGRVTAMVGPSGCGKSTLAFLAAGYHRPSGGEVRLDGEPVRGPGPERLMVFQESALMPWLSIAENVMLGPRSRGARKAEARSVAAAMLERVGLAEFARSYPSQLSGGMQRRAELARALVNEPRAMVLDEPFRGLDAMTRGLMQEYLAELCEESAAATLVITTDIDEAVLLADRILIVTATPARVREVIDVPLPRPRQRTSVLRDPRAARAQANGLGGASGRGHAPVQSTRRGEAKMKKLASFALVLVALAMAASGCGGSANGADLGSQGKPVHLVVGYQPYYSEAWSALVLKDRELWKQYLPEGSTVDFEAGLQGSILVSQMLAGKEQIGYMGDMPAIVGVSQRNVRDLRIVANVGTSSDQCGVLLVSKDAPDFKSSEEAIEWIDGKTVATPQGKLRRPRRPERVQKRRRRAEVLPQPDQRPDHVRPPERQHRRRLDLGAERLETGQRRPRQAGRQRCLRR